MKWRAILINAGERHVEPIEDLRPHFSSPLCWCRPYDDDGVWVHNSMDNREAFERGERIQS